MSIPLNQAFEQAKELSEEKQNELARIVMHFVNDEQDVYMLTPEEIASFAKSLEQAERREFASDEDVAAVYQLTPAEEADLDEAEREVERGEIVSEEHVRTILAKYRL
jgi:hypothetical protein